MNGLSYLRRNQLPEAESELKKLVTLAPNDPVGYADLGLTYLQAGRYGEAEKQLRRARELDPGVRHARREGERVATVTYGGDSAS